jgi:hypothetical protein
MHIEVNTLKPLLYGKNIDLGTPQWTLNKMTLQKIAMWHQFWSSVVCIFLVGLAHVNMFLPNEIGVCHFIAKTSTMQPCVPYLL